MLAGSCGWGDESMRLTGIVALAVWLVALAPGSPARAQEKVTFGLDWVAQAEYGGYYQAVATGLYAKRGLQVTIRQGGPQVNHMQLMIAGKLDFNLAGGRAIEFAAEGLPYLAVAAMYQKEPAVLIAHPNVGNDSFEALRGKPIAIGADTRAGWWRFLAARYGYTDSQIRPYTFNMAPFIANRNLVQQGYVSSEPFLIEKESGIVPRVLMLSDAGYLGYANIVTTSRRLVEQKPDLVQRFIDASIEGWYSYLYGDPAPANRLIREANPEMSQELIDYGYRVMKERGILDSGDALTLGIGAMTDARWRAFYESQVAIGVHKPGIDISKAYTTRFVNKRVGIELKR
jgi:NitT/TauT family transport system substrate-binding protein